MTRPAMIAAGRHRLSLGRDLRLVETTEGHLWLEGTVRLRPGQSIELVGQWPRAVTQSGRAHVVTWRVVRLTGEGPCYRGCCRLDG